jgi:hypothetical protein
LAAKKAEFAYEPAEFAVAKAELPYEAAEFATYDGVLAAKKAALA